MMKWKFRELREISKFMKEWSNFLMLSFDQRNLRLPAEAPRAGGGNKI
jgi:hypothetical protein